MLYTFINRKYFFNSSGSKFYKKITREREDIKMKNKKKLKAFRIQTHAELIFILYLSALAFFYGRQVALLNPQMGGHHSSKSRK